LRANEDEGISVNGDLVKFLAYVLASPFDRLTANGEQTTILSWQNIKIRRHTGWKTSA
jgi:hypothetical protein